MVLCLDISVFPTVTPLVPRLMTLSLTIHYILQIGKAPAEEDCVRVKQEPVSEEEDPEMVSTDFKTYMLNVYFSRIFCLRTVYVRPSVLESYIRGKARTVTAM